MKSIRHPEKLISYFRREAPVLFIVTISGLIYNIGMAAGPYFQGQLVQGLYDLLQKKIEAIDLVR